jgi:hypothetical protein
MVSLVCLRPQMLLAHAPLFTAVLRLPCDEAPFSPFSPLSPFSASSSLDAGRLNVCERALVGLAM